MILYHGTTQRNAESIMREGLRMPKGGIYVTSDKDYAFRAAREAAEGTEDLPAVLVLKQSANRFFDDGKTEFGDSYLHKSSKTKLDPKYIEGLVSA